MAKINREKFEDAKTVVEKLLPDTVSRNFFIDFLSNAIIFADEIRSDNWNLNLDINGRFLRFNTGHEYCIQLTVSELLILCNRITIKQIVEKNSLHVLYRGYINGKTIEHIKIDTVPDLLAKTKNSIGCIIKHHDIVTSIDYFNQSNKDFIQAAMKTKLMENMRQAHSVGAIDYIFSFLPQSF